MRRHVFRRRPLPALTLSAAIMACAGCSPEADVSAGAGSEPGAQASAATSLPGARFAAVWQMMGPPTRLSSDPVLTPAAQADVEAQTKRMMSGDMSDDLSAQCIPPTMPTMTTIGTQELLVDRKKITWIMESSNAIRWIWLDGREHPPAEELRPTAMGHSVGRWEGETLVVDTVGFMPKSRMYVNRPMNETVAPSPQMHVIERIRLEDDGKSMVIDRTVEDPTLLAEPWNTTVRYTRRDDWEIGEIICAENNRVEDY